MNLLKSILSKEIIQGLEKKLKIGNLRMSHLNVLPKRLLNRADLYSFSEYKETLPLEILVGITENKNWRKSISFSTSSIHPTEDLVEELFKENDQEKKDEHVVKIKILTKRLNNIAQTLFDENIEFGTKSVALGYPIIVIPSVQDKTKIIKAPLFLWSFDLEREKKKI